MGASTIMLASSVPSSSSSSYTSDSGYSSSFPPSSLALSIGRVQGCCPLPTVSGCLVFAISSSWEDEGGGFLASPKISKTSLRHRGCDRGSGVPPTLSLSFSTIRLCAAFAVLGRGVGRPTTRGLGDGPASGRPFDWGRPLAKIAGVGGRGRRCHRGPTARARLFYSDARLGTGHEEPASGRPGGALHSCAS